MPRLFFVLVLLFSALLASPQGSSSSSGLSAEERQEIMDALRLPLRSRLGGEAVLMTKRLKVHDGWLYLRATALTSSWTPSERSGSEFSALLQKRFDKWHLVTHRFGDEGGSEWGRSYGAPPELFGRSSSGSKSGSTYRGPSPIRRHPSWRPPSRPRYRAPQPRFRVKPIKTPSLPKLPAYGTPSSVCGAPTKRGGTCKRKTRGGHCYQHGGY